MDPVLLLLAAGWLFGEDDKKKLARKTQEIRDLESRLPTAPKPAARPAAKPATRPAARPAAKPAAKPAAPKPAARPAAKPATTPAAPKPAATPAAAPKPTVPPSRLVARANQQRAQDWIPVLVKNGAHPAIAEGLARWIGLESSGNPLALSPIGERGLLQATKTVALKDKLFTPAEWEKLQSPATTRDEHARLALKQYAFHVKRAKRWVANAPAASSPDWVFYAKMNHTRPLDLKEGKVHGMAAPMAKDLVTRWASEPQRVQRVDVASVVAFGKPASGGMA